MCALSEGHESELAGGEISRRAMLVLEYDSSPVRGLKLYMVGLEYLGLSSEDISFYHGNPWLWLCTFHAARFRIFGTRLLGVTDCFTPYDMFFGRPFAVSACLFNIEI